MGLKLLIGNGGIYASTIQFTWPKPIVSTRWRARRAMANYQRWVIKQEQADATREAVRKAAEQANQLEGPKRKPNS